jgi:hypothetical protein
MGDADDASLSFGNEKGIPMSSVRLTDGGILHLPARPLAIDSSGTIQLTAEAEAEFARLVPLIERDELLLFARRLISNARKRRHASRYSQVNLCRLRIARMCIDRALAEASATDGL